MAQKPDLTSPRPQANRQTAWRERAKRNRGWIAGGTAAAALVGSALFNRRAARRAEARTPPLGIFVDVDGVRLHYVDRGEGPVVVLLHGNGVLLQDFVASGVLDLAAEDHRVLAFDRPGFGYSDRPRSTVWSPAAQADLIVRALRQIGVGRAVVVGHSWGTLVALSMALDHPDAVAGLVLMSGYYHGTARPDVVSGSLPGVPVIGDVMANTVSPRLGALTGPLAVRASFAPASVPAKFAAFPAAMALRPGQIRATGADTAMMVPAAIGLSRRYGELALPVVVMAGAGDLIAHKDRHAERLVEDIAGAELRVIPSQGHLFHYAVPEQVVAAIDTVIARADRSAG